MAWNCQKEKKTYTRRLPALAATAAAETEETLFPMKKL